jgi:hypothetical protein
MEWELPPGAWVILHKMFLTSLAISSIFAFMGEGRERVLTLVALGIAFAADTMLYMLQMG